MRKKRYEKIVRNSFVGVELYTLRVGVLRDKVYALDFSGKLPPLL